MVSVGGQETHKDHTHTHTQSLLLSFSLSHTQKEEGKAKGASTSNHGDQSMAVNNKKGMPLIKCWAVSETEKQA